MKTIIYPIIMLFSMLVGCAKETGVEPDSEAPFEDMESLNCVPIIPINIDTSYLWFSLTERPFKGKQEHGVAEMVEKNKEYLWEGSAQAHLTGNEVDIYLLTVKSEEMHYSLRDLMNFKLTLGDSTCLNFVNSKDSLQPNTTFANFCHGDGDVTFFCYTVIEDDKSHLEIVKLDTLNRQVSGNFNLKLVNERPHPSPFVPDTLHFVNGSFSCKILE